MWSREEVAEIERYEQNQEFKANQKRYCGTLIEEKEELQQLVAFYQGEGKSHPIELEYQKFARILPSKRSKKQIDRLVKLARALSNAVDAADKAFKDTLNDIALGDE